MKAKLILKDRIVYEGGYIQEMVIWEVPQPVVRSQHLYKYRLFFGLPDQRIVGYDNERPKGDHRHYGEREEAYPFATIQQLVGDFLADVEEQRRQYHAEQP